MHREILDFHLENLEVRTVYRAYVLGLHLCPYAWRGFGDVRRIHSPWRFGPLGRQGPPMHACDLVHMCEGFVLQGWHLLPTSLRETSFIERACFSIKTKELISQLFFN